MLFYTQRTIIIRKSTIWEWVAALFASKAKIRFYQNEQPLNRPVEFQKLL